MCICTCIYVIVIDKIYWFLYYILVDHRLLSSKGPKVFFKEMDYGLLHIKPGNEFVESRHKILENRTDAELGYVRSMNYDTATCIIQQDFDNAKHKIDQLLQSGKYTDHVHTVCHLGILKIEKKCDTEEVIALAKKVLDLLADDKSRITKKLTTHTGLPKQSVQRMQGTPAVGSLRHVC